VLEPEDNYGRVRATMRAQGRQWKRRQGRRWSSGEEQAGSERGREGREERVRVERLVGAQPRNALASLSFFQDLSLNTPIAPLSPFNRCNALVNTVKSWFY
jgi:hypothetical protein